MKITAPVYLIGPRACGKTSVGLTLAGCLDLPFLDMDAAIVSILGESIAEFVERKGWDAFRSLETKVLLSTAASGPAVVATGGGVVMRPGNRDLLRKGTPVYLRARPAVLAARLMADLKPGQRPSLTGQDPVAEVRAVHAERDPLYNECAAFAVDAELSPGDVVRAILDHLQPAKSE